MYSSEAGWGKLTMLALANVGPTYGRIFVVCPAADANYGILSQIVKYDPDGQARLFTTLEAAYAAATTNANDVILLTAYSTHTIANGIAWSKNRIHLIGMDGGGRLVQQGAKVQTTDAVGDAYVIKVTGVRNSFKNVKFIQVDTTATSLHVLEEGGEGNLYENCSFIFGVADNLDLTTATEVLCGSDSATFRECMFGADTLLTSAARAVFTIDQVTASQEFKSNILDRCVFLISSSSATAYLLKVAANTDVLFSNLFRDCDFIASLDSAGGAALTNAITSVSGLVKGCLCFKNPGVFNCTNFSANDSSQVEVQAPASSANAFEAQAPA